MLPSIFHDWRHRGAASAGGYPFKGDNLPVGQDRAFYEGFGVVYEKGRYNTQREADDKEEAGNIPF